MTAEIDARITENLPGGPFWKVLELGYTNNPNAMAPLKKYSQQGDAFFKSCALSAMGTLGTEDTFEFVKQRYNSGGFNDRYMAIKAIGDVGTPEAVEFIKNLRDIEAYQNEGGFKSCVDLYAPPLDGQPALTTKAGESPQGK